MATDNDTGRLGNDPRRRPPRRAVIDDYSAAVLDEATLTLTLLRAPMHVGDALAELHATISLLAQIHERLPTIVAAARDQTHRWSDIAAQLGITTAEARRRYQYETTINENTR